MKSRLSRLRRYQPGDRVVTRTSNRPGIVVSVLPHGRRLVATTEPGRGRVATASVVAVRELRREVDLAA